MRIISNYSDYYDNALKYGIDPGIIFVRLRSETEIEASLNRYKKPEFTAEENKVREELSKLMFPDFRFRTELSIIRAGDWKVRRFMFEICVLFCGKIYNGLIVREQRSIPSFASLSSVQTIDKAFYTETALLEYAASTGTAVKDFEPRQRWFEKEVKTLGNYFKVRESDEILNFCVAHRLVVATLTPIDREVRSSQSYFQIGWENSYPDGIDLHPTLESYQFFKVFPHTSAFQEIAMFVGGVLPNPGPEMATISDQDRIQQHGFDSWSFKKLPTKRK